MNKAVKSPTLQTKPKEDLQAFREAMGKHEEEIMRADLGGKKRKSKNTIAIEWMLRRLQIRVVRPKPQGDGTGRWGLREEVEQTAEPSWMGFMPLQKGPQRASPPVPTQWKDSPLWIR